MVSQKMKIGNKQVLGLGFALAAAILLYLFLPVPYTLYTQPNDGGLMAADAITDKTPLQQCVDGSFENVTAVDLLLATYARQNTNTNHVEIFTLENGKKRTLFNDELKSGIVKDNDYFPISFPAVSTSGNICFQISSADATPENSITYWLNSQSQPVLKLKSTVPLHKAIEQIVGTNRFLLPMWLAVALCLLYLCANLAAIIFICHGPQAPAPHPRRTRQKRV